MKQTKQGKLLTNGVILTPHEQRTVNFLLALGHNIELIRPSHTPNSKTPDFIMDGLEWEMKCPRGKSKYTIRDNLRTALRQSPNIIIELRCTKLNQAKALNDAKKYFFELKNTNNLSVITNNKIFDFHKEV